MFFSDMERVEVQAYMTPPRLLGHGYKPRGTQTAYRSAPPGVRGSRRAAIRDAPDPMVEQLRSWTYERQRLGRAAPNARTR